jgi:transposase
MKVYDQDLRMKIVEARNKGHRWKEITEMFGISRMTGYRYEKSYRETGNVDQKKRIYPRKVSNASILEYVQENRDALQKDIAKVFRISTSTICKSFSELGLKIKKK